MFGSSIPLGPPKWCDGGLSEVLKDAKTSLEIQQEVDEHSMGSSWPRVSFWDFERDLEGPNLPVKYWTQSQFRSSTLNEDWCFAGLIMNDLLRGLCDSALSPIAHSLETLASERRQHFR